MSLIYYPDRCTACGQCVEVCPFGVLRLEGEELIIGEGCNLCGACIEVCEVEALALPETEGPAPRPEVPPDGFWEKPGGWPGPWASRWRRSFWGTGWSP
jgi:electron transfer flavoprotein alpha subunit